MMYFFYKFDGTPKNKRDFRINLAMLIGFTIAVIATTGAAVIIARTVGEKSHVRKVGNINVSRQKLCTHMPLESYPIFW